MRIKLSEIPEEGRSYNWSKETGEVTHALKDLIGAMSYTAAFTIRPINSRDFEMLGSIKTEVPEACSRCGIDFKFKVDQKFHEILIPLQPGDRTGKYARVNHISEASQGGPSSLEYNSNGIFEMGEYLHEQVAIALPFNPAPPEKANGDCSLCEKPVRGLIFKYDEEMPEEKAETPFQALKNLKIQ